MSSSNARTIQRRDAAVTAALAGGVLVILGYASGIGIKPASEAAAAISSPSPSPEVVAPAQTPAPPEPVPAQDAAAPAAVSLPAPPPPVAAAPTPTTAPTSAPATGDPASPEASPTPSAPDVPSSAPTCPADIVGGLVSQLPVVPDVLSLVSSLLTTPLVGTSTAPDATPAPLTCTVASLAGTTCCPPAASARTSGGTP